MKNYKIILDYEQSRIEVTKSEEVDNDEIFATFEEAQLELDNHLSNLIDQMNKRLNFIRNTPCKK